MERILTTLNLTAGVAAAITTGIMLTFGLIGRQQGGQTQLELSVLFFGIFLFCLAVDSVIRPRPKVASDDEGLSEKWLRKAHKVVKGTTEQPLPSRKRKAFLFGIAVIVVALGAYMAGGDAQAARFLANFGTELVFILAASFLVALAIAGKRKSG